MFKKISNVMLLLILSMSVVFAVVKAQPVESSSAPANAIPAETGVQKQTQAVVVSPTPEKQAAVENKTVATPKSSGNTAIKSLKQIFKEKGIDPAKTTIGIVVDKSDHTLGVTADGKIMKTYHVELGDGGLGDKKVSGDHKTPEGSFYLTEKSVLSPADYYLGSRWMELGYPNIEDADRGLKSGIISKKTYDSIVSAIKKGVMPPQNTALGGGVGIHGGSRSSFGSDWTWGCVGLTNNDVEDFYSYIKVGTKVTISR
jgi:murein L,D-transpeptidase YafK